MRLLLHFGADIDMRSFAGETPRTLASRSGCPALLSALSPSSSIGGSTEGGGAPGSGEANCQEPEGWPAIQEFLITGRDEVWIARPASPGALDGSLMASLTSRHGAGVPDGAYQKRSLGAAYPTDGSWGTNATSEREGQGAEEGTSRTTEISNRATEASRAAETSRATEASYRAAGRTPWALWEGCAPRPRGGAGAGLSLAAEPDGGGSNVPPSAMVDDWIVIDSDDDLAEGTCRNGQGDGVLNRLRGVARDKMAAAKDSFLSLINTPF